MADDEPTWAVISNSQRHPITVAVQTRDTRLNKDRR